MKKLAVPGSRTQDTSSLNQPPQSSICTAQVVLNASLAPRELGYEANWMPQSTHSVCTVRILLGVDQKIFSIRKEPMQSGFLTLNAESILHHAGSKWIWMLWGKNRGKWKSRQSLGVEPRTPLAVVAQLQSTVLHCSLFYLGCALIYSCVTRVQEDC